MNVSLPDELKAYVDERTARGTYGSTSEYMRELIRHDRDLNEFRSAIRAGLDSPVEGSADEAFFAALRARHQAR